MSNETRPIDPVRFSRALEDLPLDALYSKVAEISNSLNHLKSSNEQMLPFARDGDADCIEAMSENEAVMRRIHERLALLRVEIEEKRNMPWVEGELEDSVSVMANGNSGDAHGDSSSVMQGRAGGRLTDDQLREEMGRRLAGDDVEDEEGVHL